MVQQEIAERPRLGLTIERAGGSAIAAIKRNGGAVARPNRRTGRTGFVLTFPEGTEELPFTQAEEAAFHLEDCRDLRWFRLPDGTILVGYIRLGHSCLAMPVCIADVSLEWELRFLRARWRDYRMLMRRGGIDADRDAPKVMHEQILRSARRIALLFELRKQVGEKLPQDLFTSLLTLVWEEDWEVKSSVFRVVHTCRPEDLRQRMREAIVGYLRSCPGMHQHFNWGDAVGEISAEGWLPHGILLVADARCDGVLTVEHDRDFLWDSGRERW